MAHASVAEGYSAPSRLAADEADYDAIRRAIAFISAEWQSQPSLARVAAEVDLEPLAFQRRFTRIAGLTPKTFLQAVTLNRTRQMLAGSASVEETSLTAGLSGTSRLHDLYVTHEAMPPGAYRARGAGLTMAWGFHPTPFGLALIVANQGRLAGIGFAEPGEETAVLDEFRRRWPKAAFVKNADATRPFAQHVFNRSRWQPGTPLRLVLIGSDFEIRVWEALLNVPFASATTYADVAAEVGKPKAARAVGAAVGRNPISFVVPCHRVLGKGGGLTGYHWGLTRKRAILGWEAGIAEQG
jgi:AraC family transcriptional regulator of adaptative response/methylated-DNA-[protein]-cysteine methyltransferase